MVSPLGPAMTPGAVWGQNSYIRVEAYQSPACQVPCNHRAGGTGMAGVAAATPIFLLFRPNIFTFLNFPSRTEVHRFIYVEISGPVELGWQGWQLPPQ